MKQKHPVSHCGRRALSLLLAAIMVLGFLPGFPGAGSEASAHWADPYLSQLAEWGFIRQDQINNPDRALTRADFMSIVNRAYGYHDLGETPFEDVLPSDWFYDDVGIAYTAKYILGTSPTTASPRSPLTRETAATILGRNMMLEESPGSLVEFTDSNRISTWAMGTIKSSLEHYLISGYSDGSFRPQRNVSWGEMASMITSLIGTPLQEPGDYSLGGVFGNVTITSPDVTLRDTVISGDLYISGGVGLGGIKLENVTVLGRIIASGTGNSESGEASILLRNVTADEMLIDNLQDNFVSIQADGITQIGRTTVRTSAYIQDNTPDGMGLHYIFLEGDSYPEGEEPEGWTSPLFQLAGRIEEVVNRTPNSTVQVGQGTVAKLTVDEAAVGSNVIIDRGAVVKELNLDTATIVTGEGDIEHLIVNAPGCEVEMLPDKIDIRPGITAIIAGEVMDTVGAEESSEEPMILAGYPQAQDVVPTGLDAAFMTNKAGTVYWAVTYVSDGSVGEDELIKPPSYGYQALAHGSVAAAKGNEEIISKVTGLVPGGDYYLSAILVDARGQRSTVKVASFSTPDNTTPAFCSGYPHMSKVSCQDSVVVIMPNKTCKLYYALLPVGAVAPTESELRAGAVAGMLGYGVRDVFKNTEDAFRVNDVKLEEQTEYVLYLWLTDADGMNKGQIVSLRFKTPDETPPEFVVDPIPNKIQATSVGLTFQLNEDGMVYWVAVPEGTVYPKPEPGTDFDFAPQDSDYGKMQIELGMNLGVEGKSGSVRAKAFANGTINVTGLKPETAYDFYYLAKDNAGNYSLIWKKVTINTLDTNGPKVSQSFSRTSGTDKTKDPLSSTAIYLDFSENVRFTGPQGGKGFLELYQEVKNTNESPDAINLLAANLWGAIKLHQVNLQDNSEIIIGETHNTSNPFTKDMTIDYTKATVEARKDGGIRVTFPSNGLHLENGAEYYFTIGDITDTSNNQNEISPDPVDFWVNAAVSASAGHSVPPFIVEFASVDLTSPGIRTGNGPVQRDANGNPVTETVDGKQEAALVPVDLSFRMTPNSTSTVNEMISYDVLLWTDTILSFDLYYRVVNERGEQISTVDANNDLFSNYEDPYSYTAADGSERNPGNYLIPNYKHTNASDPFARADKNGWYYLGNSSQMSPSPEKKAWSGRSVNSFFNGCRSTNFPLLQNLSEDLRYEFVICLTKLGEYENRDVWNDEVKFHVNVAAGQSNNLSDMGSALTTEMWDTYLKRGMSGGAQSIGWWNNHENQRVNTMELNKPFIDSSLPTFTNQTPVFESDASKSDSMTMVLNLTSPGTVYYAIGRAEASAPGAAFQRPEINTTRKIMNVDLALAAQPTEPIDPTQPTDEPVRPSNVIRPVESGKTGVGDLMYVTLDSPNPPLHGNASQIANTPWMIGGISPETTDATAPFPMDIPEEDNLLVSPTPLSIFNPRTGNLAGSNKTIITGNTPVPSDSVQVGNSATIEVTGLQPNTSYYAYFVLKGKSDQLSHVYLFQFTTPEASKPRIILEPQDNGDMNMALDVATTGGYRVYSLDDISKISILQKKFADYTKDGPYELPKYYRDLDMTVLEALTNDYYYRTASSLGEGTYPSRDGLYEGVFDEGYSIFDIYANDSARNEIYYLITNASLVPPETVESPKPWNYGGSTKTPAPNSTDRWQDQPYTVKTGSQIANAQYLFLTFAINVNMTGSTDYKNASFHASSNLQKGNLAPPEVKKEGSYGAIGDIKKNPTGNTYSGKVVIQFNKQAFLYNDNSSSPIRFTNTNVLSGIKEAIPTGTTISDAGTTSFTLNFNGWKLNDMVRFPGSEGEGYFANQGNVFAPKTLRIQIVQDTKDQKIYLEVQWGDGSDKEWDHIARIPLTEEEVGDYLVMLTGTGVGGSGPSFNPRTLTLNVGDSTDVTATLDKDDLQNTQYGWSLKIDDGADEIVSLKDDDKAKVTITGDRPGTVTVVATAYGLKNGTFVTAENTIEVTVLGEVTSLSANDLELHCTTAVPRPSGTVTATISGNDLSDTAKLNCEVSNDIQQYVNVTSNGTTVTVQVTKAPPEDVEGTVTVSLVSTDGKTLTKTGGEKTLKVKIFAVPATSSTNPASPTPASDTPSATPNKAPAKAPANPTLTLNPASVMNLSMDGTKSSKLTASSNGTISGITWESSTPQVAAISGSGTSVTVTAKSIGFTTITAKATVGGKTLTKEVTVYVSGSLTGASLNSPKNNSNVSMSGTNLTLKRSASGTSATLAFTAGNNASINSTAKIKVLSVTDASGNNVMSSGYLVFSSTGGNKLTVSTGDGTPGANPNLKVTVGIVTNPKDNSAERSLSSKQMTFTVTLTGNDSGLNIAAKQTTQRK